MPQTSTEWVLTILATLVGYELIRWAIVRGIKERLRAGALSFVRRHRVELESARFIDRIWLRETLLMDPEIDEIVLQQVDKQGVSLRKMRHRVGMYIDEIAPAFSITAYYRVGRLVAGTLVRFAYELVFDHGRFRRVMAQVPPGARVVFVMNHRSNFDYLVLSYGLLKHVALSYAVGEWALVWPIDKLFKAFGSYFVRRGEKDPVYHRVLERFIQLLVGHGGVTGFFLEGRFTRDGRMGTPKSGLVDFMVGVLRSSPDAEVAFIPVGINFDRVLEDETLLAERDGKRPPPTLLGRLRSLVGLLLSMPVMVGANLAKVATRSHRKLGYAAISVGTPVLASTHGFAGPSGLAHLPRKERRPHVDALATTLLGAIESTIPATPVPVFCLAFAGVAGETGVTRGQLTSEVRSLIARLRTAKAPIAFGDAFPIAASAETDIPGLDDQLAAQSEAEMVVTLAGYALERRDLVRFTEGRFELVDDGARVMSYYANSIVHYLEGPPTS
jgi:glycerol-3-phosphate O-acyltransferase